MSQKPKPYPKNVAGDFYVEDGCCITCMVPEAYAPNLMGFDEENTHCFVAKQPTDENEVYQILKAAWAAEVGCIRYGGKNPQILKRLAEAGVSEACDEQQLVHKIKPLLRNHVTFEYSQIQTESELANELKDYILSKNAEYDRYKVSRTKTDKLGTTFSFSWYENNYHSIWFSRTESANVWHIFHSLENEVLGSKSISLLIDEWLKSVDKFSAVKWQTNREWKSFLPANWEITPI